MNRFLPPFLCCALLIGLGCAGDCGGDADTLRNLRGIWRVEYAELGGKPTDNEELRGLTITFGDDNQVVTEVNGTRHEGTFALNLKRSPHHLDLHPGPGEGDLSELYGIWSLDSPNGLRVCFSQKSRPNGFATNPRSDAILLELKRVNPRDTPEKFTAGDLIDECRSNRSVAASKFNHQIMKVTGTVIKNTDGRIELEGSGGNYVECRVSGLKSELHRTMSIKPNQTVTLRGTYSGIHEKKKGGPIVVQLHNCEIVTDEARDDRQAER